MSNSFADSLEAKSRRNLCLDDMPIYTYETKIENQTQNYEREIEKYLQKSLDSTGRSLQKLESSERLAGAAARDLISQREKLERAERGADEIRRTTQLTQRSLNGLLSVFGGFFKNRFSRAPPQPPTINRTLPISSSKSQLTEVLSNQNRVPSAASSNKRLAPTLNAQSRANIAGTRWQAMDEQTDNNLDEMSSSLARLRQMSAALGDEIEDQNRLLERLHEKTERNESTIRNQDNQMKRLLGQNN